MAETTSTPLRLLSDLAFRHWGTKLAALLLAVILFVITRDEVTRGFEVPLRVIDDPGRVLLTDLPETIQVQVRGPWTRVNRLQDYDLGSATLDLRAAGPGPLEIDRASIVMPSGVILAGIQYDHVDLRFDAIVERALAIDAPIVGTPAEDYEIASVEVTPERWAVRGGESFVNQVSRLATEPIDVEGAVEDVVKRPSILKPPPGVQLVRPASENARVDVRVAIVPREDARSFPVPVIVPESVDPTGAIPRTYEVEISGPVPDLRALEESGLAFPVEAVAELVSGSPAAGGVAEVRFSWAESVPTALRERLHLDHGVERVNVPPAPPPPPTLDLPGAGQ